MAQNKETMEQWGVLEESRKWSEDRLEGLSTNDAEQRSEADEEEQPVGVRLAWDR